MHKEEPRGNPSRVWCQGFENEREALPHLPFTHFPAWSVGRKPRLPAEAASVLWLVPLRTDIAARGTEAGQPLKGAEEMMWLQKLKESRARGSDKGWGTKEEGHSTSRQVDSADRGPLMLLSRGVPPEIHLSASPRGLLRGQGKWRILFTEDANLTGGPMSVVDGKQ